MLKLAPEKKKVIIAAGLVFLVFFSSTAIGVMLSYERTEKRNVNVEKLLTQAKEEYYQGNYKTSIAEYEKIIELSDSIQARKNLAAIYEEIGKYDLAIEEYREILAKNNSYELKLSLAIAYYNTGQLQEAKKSLEQIISSAKTDKNASDYIYKESYYYLALIQKQQKNYSSADSYLLKALDYRKWALGYFELGEIDFLTKDYNQAIKYYRQALQTDGSLKGVTKKLGLAYLKLNKSKQAANYLQKAKREFKNDQIVNQKISKLKEEYPDYFKDPELPPEKDEIPKNVTFEEVSPLENPGQKLRIGIMTNQTKIYFRVGSSFDVVADNKVIAQGAKEELGVVTIESGITKLEIGDKKFAISTAIQIKPDDYVPILVHQVEYGSGYYWGGKQDIQYRGELEIRADGDKLTAVNIVPLESYLMSVVPSEMSASWPLEALKVQSVAARSYTLANLDKHSKESYNLCSTVHCAAYRGINREHSRTNQAVKATAGEIMTYNGRAINAVYSANSGGHTENSEDVWSFEIPYLRAVSTEINQSKFPLAPAKLKDWLQEIPKSYSNDKSYTKLSHYRWQRELDVEYLESRLGIAEIKQIIPTKRGTGGSVEAVLVVGENETKKFKNGLRYKFGGLRSNSFWVQPKYKAGQLDSFVFYGGGWGHNVGMDQVAVASMADSSYNYKEILQHFYTGIEFENSNSDE